MSGKDGRPGGTGRPCHVTRVHTSDTPLSGSRPSSSVGTRSSRTHPRRNGPSRTVPTTPETLVGFSCHWGRVREVGPLLEGVGTGVWSLHTTLHWTHRGPRDDLTNPPDSPLLSLHPSPSPHRRDRDSVLSSTPEGQGARTLVHTRGVGGPWSSRNSWTPSPSLHVQGQSTCPKPGSLGDVSDPSTFDSRRSRVSVGAARPESQIFFSRQGRSGRTKGGSDSLVSEVDSFLPSHPSGSRLGLPSLLGPDWVLSSLLGPDWVSQPPAPVLIGSPGLPDFDAGHPGITGREHLRGSVLA